MKKTLVFVALACVLCWVSSCGPEPEPETSAVTLDELTFDEISLPEEGFLNNASFKAGRGNGNSTDNNLIEFVNHYDPTYNSWDGFALSKLTDTVTASYTNDLSVCCGYASSKEAFAVAYYASFAGPATFTFTDGQLYELYGVKVCNSTYAYKSMRDGNAFCRKFADGDWFKSIWTGYDLEGNETGKVEIFLADFRDGKQEILDTWHLVKLGDLGKVARVDITFESTDTGEWGINTPTYICLDDLSYYRKSPKLE